MLLCCCSVAQLRLTFAIPWTAAHQTSLSFTISQNFLKLMSIKLVMPSNHLTLVTPFSCPQSFSASGSFPVSQLFASGGQIMGASASVSVLPMNIKGSFPLGLMGLISLQSKGLTSTTIQKHPFFDACLLHGPTLTSVHDYWKNHSFYYMDLCWQSNVFAF